MPDTGSIMVESGLKYFVDMRSGLSITFSMNVPSVSGVLVGFNSPNVTEIYDVYLKLGSQGNANMSDYSLSSSLGLINATYSECNVNSIVGEWYFTIIKRGPVKRYFYYFTVTYGQPGIFMLYIFSYFCSTCSCKCRL